jgi:hypothetical protein
VVDLQVGQLAVGSLGRWHVASVDIGRPGARLAYPALAR